MLPCCNACAAGCRFSSDDEAVMLANDTEYGLAAYFYTRDLKRAWHIAERLEYGMVSGTTSVHIIWGRLHCCKWVGE
jgi:acyl-CoA reductase-like NAD-dependent aldehyde dehydrogenase